MTVRKVQIGDATLYRGDCLDVLPTLESVDAVVTDPPYESYMHVAKQGSRGIRTDGCAEMQPLDFSCVTDIRGAVSREMCRLSAGWVLAFCAPEGVAAWRDAIEAAGARYKRACVWVKPDSAPQFNGQGPAMGAEMFVAAWAGKGHSRWNGGGRRNVFTHMCNPGRRESTHPTEKPLSLMQELVGLFTQWDDVVCDPFMGSGTTGVACAKMGRKFIGVEFDPEYFEIACKRIEDAYRQADMFVPRPGEPPLKQMDCFRAAD